MDVRCLVNNEFDCIPNLFSWDGIRYFWDKGVIGNDDSEPASGKKRPKVTIREEGWRESTGAGIEPSTIDKEKDG